LFDANSARRPAESVAWRLAYCWPHRRGGAPSAPSQRKCGAASCCPLLQPAQKLVPLSPGRFGLRGLMRGLSSGRRPDRGGAFEEAWSGLLAGGWILHGSFRIRQHLAAHREVQQTLTAANAARLGGLSKLAALLCHIDPREELARCRPNGDWQIYNAPISRGGPCTATWPA